MKRRTVGTVIAERVLDLKPGKRVVVKIGKPRKHRGYDTYVRAHEVRRPDRTQIFYAVGIDTVQALHLGLQMTGTTLYISEAAKQGKLTWLGGRNLGFPVPDIIADIVPKDSGRKALKPKARRSSARTKRKTA